MKKGTKKVMKKASKKAWNAGVIVGKETAKWGFRLGLGILATAATVHVSKEIDKQAENYKV